MSAPMHTLPGDDYRSEEIFKLECETIFTNEWMYAGRDEALAAPGDRLVVDVGNESVLIVRDRSGQLQAFYNVCRHRGSQLCESSGSGFGGAITCPYHAWSYSLDGKLVATPRVGADEVDRSQLSLWPVAVDSWQNFIFVCLAAKPTPLMQWLEETPESPLDFDHLDLASLRIGAVTTSEVEANWKILVENYSECLHCPTVHPELVEIIPTYRTGSVVDETRSDGGVAMLAGVTAYAPAGSPALPIIGGMTELDKESYYGAAVFPNVWFDINASVITTTRLIARSAQHTTIVMEYLLPPETLADPKYDISHVIDFTELVTRQDNDICARAQKGINSRAFTQGIFAPKDFIAHAFTRYYLERRGPARSERSQ